MLQEKENLMKPPEKVMMKSLSMGKIPVPSSLESMTRASSLNDKDENILTSQLKNQTFNSPGGSTEKKSHFFSTSHSNILEQQR